MCVANLGLGLLCGLIITIMKLVLIAIRMIIILIAMIITVMILTTTILAKVLSQNSTCFVGIRETPICASQIAAAANTSQVKCPNHMDGCQNYGTFSGTLNIGCCIVIGIQKKTRILTTAHSVSANSVCD